MYVFLCREVQPRSHLKVHERKNSYDSFASSQDFYQPTTSYDSSTIHGYPMRRPQNQDYAESLQDFEIRPRLHRSNSGSSLRSDSVLMRRQVPESTTQPTTDSYTLPPRSRAPPDDTFTQYSQSRSQVTDSYTVASPRRESEPRQITRQPQNSTVTRNQGWKTTEETKSSKMVPPKVKPKPKLDASPKRYVPEEYG